MASSSVQKARQFIDLFKVRRSIYALGRRAVLPDAETIELIKTSVRESPSSFNSQTSRVVVLLGDEHEKYWLTIVKPTLRKVVTDDATFEKGAERLELFRKAYGTALFYEDQDAIKALQEKAPLYADRFPQWSAHATGMAQLNTWTVLELAGFGASLQHYGNLTQGPIAEAYSIPASWTLHAELVFGSPEAEPKEKEYIDDAERFKVFGQQPL